MSPTEDTFELAVKVLSAAYAFERRAEGHLAHRPIPDATAGAIAAFLPGVLTPLESQPLLGVVQEAEACIQALSPDDLRVLTAALDIDAQATPWRPIPGAQALAWEVGHIADQTLLAGGAGSGKSLAALMLAAMSSKAARVIRKTSLEFTPMLQELAKLTGSTDGRNLSTARWELPAPFGHNATGTNIEFTALGDDEARLKVQGRASDLQLYDDCASGNLAPDDLAFVSRWNRTTVPGLKSRVILTANPPTSVHGEWIKAMFAPWLDDSHPRPAASGELRWMDADNREVQAGTPGAVLRTCVTSTVLDNPYLLRGGYLQQLEQTPDAVLRAKLLHNDWNTATEDDAYQVFPSKWLDAAFARYSPSNLAAISACGLDVARGGSDFSVLALRRGHVIPPLYRWPGVRTPDGHSLAALVLAARGNSRAPVMVDAIGVGSGAVDALRPKIFEQCVPINVSRGTKIMDSTGSFSFVNIRSWLAWNLRQLLDPQSANPLAIAPDKTLRAELLAYRYSISAGRLAVEGKDEIVKRLHRSPDAASAVMLACIPTNSTIAQQSSLARAMARWATA